MSTNKPYDDSHWREESKPYTQSKLQLEVLENGPRSLAQSWMMQAMKNQWKKRNGYKDPEPPDCSSSLQEWEQIAKKYENSKREEFTPENDPYGGY
jgi:hypothetical protein